MSTAATHLHTLPSGTVIHVAANGHSLGPATPIPGGCPDLIEVPSGHPEPDSPSDMWTIRPCGAPMFETHGNPDGYTCTGGHTYQGIQWEWAVDGALEAVASVVGREPTPDEAAQFRAMATR